MHEYETELYEDVNNPQYKFYKLHVDGSCQFDEFIDMVWRNKSDKKSFMSIIAYMDGLTDQNHYPSSKFNHIEDPVRHDIYEFKKDRLRVYVVKQKPDIYIILGGFKGTQKKDINHLKSLLKGFKEGDAA